MNVLNRTIQKTDTYTERILQFGEGNFLRAFANWMIQEMNEKAHFDGGVVVIQPIEQGFIKILNHQDGLYTVYLNGIKNEKALSEHKIIDCIQRGINPYINYDDYLANAINPNLRFVISNTTEAGIVYNNQDQLGNTPQSSFPGKLTALLYERFKAFKGASDKGLIMIPCELIDKNGDNLKKIILQLASNWNLGEGFVNWIENDNIFCNTLVDRIVTGHPKDKMDVITKELGYKDNLVVEGEQFYLWVIEAPKSVKNEIPAQSSRLNIVFTDNMEPYRTRKVRILNGAHTSLVPVGFLYGIDTVRESLEDKVLDQFLKKAIFQEICPTLDLPREELTQFSNDVLDRFRNPYLEHALLSISLNSISKYKTRVLPSVLEFVKRKNELPKHLLFSLAALIAFYKGDRNGKRIPLKDEQNILDFFAKQWATREVASVAKATLQNESFWGVDLTLVDGLEKMVASHLEDIVTNGMVSSLQKFMK